MLLVGAGVAAALHVLAPPPPAATTIRVAARDLPAGQALAAGDLVEVAVPPGVVPEGVVAAPEGRLLAAPLRAGEPVTDVRLVGPDLADSLPAHRAAVPVRLSDAGQAALLTVGDRVDLIATDAQAGTARSLAQDALVLALPEPSQAQDGAQPGRLVVMGLDSAQIEQATAASVGSYVTYRWHRR